jgi:aspartate/methionine/tyrosine aminotransferase
MNYAAFQGWREQRLREDPDLLDCADTQLYRALAALQPGPAAVTDKVHRCDLARAWLERYGFPSEWSRRALVCRGVRHALGLIFRELGRQGAALWLPGDVYPVYQELAHAHGLLPRRYDTLPAPALPAEAPADGGEYLLIANPWKPLGRFLSEQETSALLDWLEASPRRHLLIDAVYDLGAPFDAGTRRLLASGRAMLLHSVTKGWLWPQTFGIALAGETQHGFEAAFRDDPPTPAQLQLAQRLLAVEADRPRQIAAALAARAARLFARLPIEVAAQAEAAARECPGNYFFPVDLPAPVLAERHRILAVPASAFGARWQGSILTCLSPAFAETAA